MSIVKDIAEGKPLRTPVHPALVHLPIALFPLSLLLDVAGWIFSDEQWALVRPSFVALLGGIVTALIAAIFGLVDYSDIRVDHRAKKIARRHMLLNVVAIVLFAASAWLRYPDLDASRTPMLPMVISFVGVAFLSYSGYLGGHLVYSDGIGVGRHRRKRPPPHATLDLPTEGDPLIPVIESKRVGEGESLRVEVAGVIVVIARVAGKVHAFQEFCTHRYGPLSEGALSGHEVICPWHCSKFDVRTGKVTAGPAKVDLRTFRVEIKHGKIWIERPTKLPGSR